MDLESNPPINPIAIRASEDRRVEEGIDDEAFLDIIERHASERYCVVLLSGGDHDCGRYSIIGRKPFLVFRSKGDMISIRTSAKTVRLRGDPLAALDSIFLHGLQPDFPLLVEPFCGGAMGYFAYELKNQTERLPQRSVDDLRLPDILLFFPSSILVHDREEETVAHVKLTPLSRRGDPLMPLCDTRPMESSGTWASGRLESNFTREEYLKTVNRIRAHIREGDVYQVNLSQRFTFEFAGDPFRLWKTLFLENPAPFFAFINAPDHQILSTSMERFIRRKGGEIETRPIKGTRRRGADAGEDSLLRAELASSPKDGAELSMIVDLLRNDLGKVCRPGSIGVAEHKRVEAYRNVFHLVSIVKGRLLPGITNSRLIRAVFPGGSVTGCPKIRAMEIIDQLEPDVRHVYTGAIGYLGWHDNLDLCVAIRTAIAREGRCHFGVGGGIVYDSRAEDEYDETLHKAQTLLQIVEAQRRHGG